MNDEATSVSWQALREFADVDLTRSFVLSWHVEADTLAIDVDLYLEPTHPFYEKPRPAEKACIRPACIEFPYCGALRLDREEAGEPVEIAKELGHGAIADLAVVGDGRYALRGDFGTVSIIAERPILRLAGP